MKVLYISYEVAPIYKFGGLGDVAGTLPKALKKLGIDVRIGMPAYEGFPHPETLPQTIIPMLYARDSELLGSVNKEKGNPAKGSVGFAYFAKAILESAKRIDFKPDIIHCNDWHTGLVPALIKLRHDPFFANTKTLLTIHNSNYQGIFQLKFLLNHKKTQDIGALFTKQEKKFINYLRTGAQYADFVNTVSPHFAQEIKGKKFGFGIGGLLRKRKRKFIGILNGIDYTVWNSSTDRYIKYCFDKENYREGKQKNKAFLQKSLGLAVSNDIPLLGVVTRITWQKGFDILIPALSKMGKMNHSQIIVLGSGYRGITERLTKISKQYANIVVYDGYDERLAHQIFASSDFFLIPSIFEPCGLTQMISMAYGTIPIASAVGGLVDTIDDEKTGFLFYRHSTRALLGDMQRALRVYNTQGKLDVMRKACLRQDFSWEKSAKAYKALYKKLL